jgi:leucyl/phenylalanyl-tRNA--protein transferase
LLYPVSYAFDSLSPEEVLDGYTKGVFPMGNEDDTFNWFGANPRTIIPLKDDKHKFHIPRSLQQVIKKNIYEIKIDKSFKKVITCCAERKPTWINKLIIDTYVKLHKMGYAHSVEAYKDNELVGGLYGVALKGAFFGESMFHIESNASKVAVVNLYEILSKNDFLLFDIQMKTPVFEIFRAIDVTKNYYLSLLKKAMMADRAFKL